MEIRLVSLLVDDQDKAEAFYIGKLGFEKCHDIPLGPYRWLTVTAPEGAAGVELVLEPVGFDFARDYQRALHDAGIPATAFISRDIDAEYARLKAAGVTFRSEPVNQGPNRLAMFEDGCGNLLQLVQTSP